MDAQYIILVLLAIIISMTLHEVMHGYMSYLLGDDTARHLGRLTLNPIKHLDPFMSVLLPLVMAISGGPIFGGAKPVPFNPNNIRWGEWGVALVAIAGPLTNLFIAFVSFGILRFLPDAGLITSFMTIMVMVNLGFFAFNMLPIPPLDGSRVVYALAPDFVRNGMRHMERFGIIIVFALIIAAGSAISKIMLAIINFFLTGFNAIFHVI